MFEKKNLSTSSVRMLMVAGVVSLSLPSCQTDNTFIQKNAKVAHIPTDQAEEVLLIKDYLVVSDEFAGLKIYNVSDPKAPARVAHVNTGGIVEDAFYRPKGKVLFVANGRKGLAIYGLSDMANPAFLGQVDLGSGSYAVSVKVDGNRAYVAAGGAGLFVVDVSNLSNPVVCARRNTRYWSEDIELDLNVRGRDYVYACDGQGPNDYSNYDEDPDNAIDNVTPADSAEFVDNASGVLLFEATKPCCPKLKGNILALEDAERFTMNRNLRCAGGSGSALGVVSDRYAGIEIWNFSNPMNPKLMDHFMSGGNYFEAQVVEDFQYKKGDKIETMDLLFVTAGRDELKIIDITNPRNIKLLTSLETPGFAQSVEVKDKRWIFVADGSKGVQVYDGHKIRRLR